jgi:hypothetical protein
MECIVNKGSIKDVPEEILRDGKRGPANKTILNKIIKTLLLVIAVSFLYLFALNGRYEIRHNNDTPIIVIDKWSGKIIVIGKDENVTFKF